MSNFGAEVNNPNNVCQASYWFPTAYEHTRNYAVYDMPGELATPGCDPGTCENEYCSNTGEIAGIVIHEWAHGLDAFDNGPWPSALSWDIPSEAYADITSMIATRTSCLGRGIYVAGTCTGYGNACLECTGSREMDWDKRQEHVPSTGSGFITA